jgi:sedoheptulose-bisphosphatase
MNSPFLNMALESVLKSLSDAFVQIAAAIQTSELGKVGTTNASGEEQIALDVLSNTILCEHLRKNEHVATMASEEMGEEERTGRGNFAVVWDPLDGSSLVDVNLSIGTIFGIYEGATLIGRIGREMIAAGLAVYGPRTTMIIARANESVKEYQLTPQKEWKLSKDDIRVGEGKMFSPGNLRAVVDREDYLGLVEWWMKQGYTLRYSGGMVPDVNQILLKGKGIFSYPGYSEAPQGKLRLLYECAPLAYVMECAGGAASDGHQPILDKVIEATHQRTPIYIGSKAEVARCEKLLG